ncbi:MAG: sodium-dependent transporter [Synergistaceae bacterium]|jgi:NSS family neurotransmitter:Na+ symporter|nr:sodium-dependent transporter [Synergistaceae bacterium]
MNEKRGRESLGSRLGFILVSAGCAIGLGNVWRFPSITGRYGGAAFVLIYLVFILCLAMPIMVMEFAVGRGSGQSIVGSFRQLQPKGTSWSIFGYFGLAGNYILMMFYTTVAGWMLAYTWYTLTGSFEGLSPDETGAFFGAMLMDPKMMTFWMFAVVAAGSAICACGVQRGVERATKLMMSGLFVLMIALAIRAVTLPGAEKGIEFYLKPDFGRLVENGLWDGIYAALGQSFFTLSLGIGSMAIFGSYIDREHSLAGESIIITALDTFVALCAGLIIFPACFAHGVEPGAGPGLIFVTLPNMFNSMSQGRLWGTLFFLFMSFAAMTTVVAVFEHLIVSSMDILGWSRKKSSIVNILAIFFLSLPCVFGFNIWSSFEPLGSGSGVLDLEDFIVSNNLLPLGAFVYLLFCCSRYGWGWEKFTAEANQGRGIKIASVMRPYFTYVVPTAIIIIFIFGYYEKFFK